MSKNAYMMQTYDVHERPAPPPKPHPSGLSQTALHALTVPSTSCSGERHTDVFKADFLRRVVRREERHHAPPPPGRRARRAHKAAADAHAA